MARKSYSITETAGRYVAGTRNTGVGTILRLTEKEAEAGLRDGTIALVGDEEPQESAFAVSTITGTAAGHKDEPDTVPQASQPDAPALPAGTATVEQAVAAQREAEGATDAPAEPIEAEKTARRAAKPASEK